MSMLRWKECATTIIPSFSSKKSWVHKITFWKKRSKKKVPTLSPYEIIGWKINQSFIPASESEHLSVCFIIDFYHENSDGWVNRKHRAQHVEDFLGQNLTWQPSNLSYPFNRTAWDFGLMTARWWTGKSNIGRKQNQDIHTTQPWALPRLPTALWTCVHSQRTNRVCKFLVLESSIGHLNSRIVEW